MEGLPTARSQPAGVTSTDGREERQDPEQLRIEQEEVLTFEPNLNLTNL